MKKILTLLTILTISLTAYSQTKPAILKKGKQPIEKVDSTKAPKVKQYTLFLVVDSANYEAVKTSIINLSNDLDNSNIPHDRVKTDQNFIGALYKLFESEKKNQDKPVDKKTPEK